MRRSKHRLPVVVTTSALLAIAHAVSAATLTWDSTGTTPSNPTDGSGVWNDTLVRWSNGSADQVWVDGNNAVIGHGTGHAAYTITLGANINAASLKFLSPGSTASYTINGNANASTNFSGYTLATTTGNWNISNAKVTLTNGVFVDGSPGASTDNLFDATTYVPNITNTGTLTIGGGAVYQTAGLYGNFTGTTGSSTVYFNGGTLQPAVTNEPILYHTSSAYISTGGLIVDTSRVTTGAEVILDPLLHDPSVGTDGGLTLNGGGVLYLGSDENGFDPTFTYNGPTVVNNGVLVLDTSGHTLTTTHTPGSGPFPNTNFTINTDGQLALASPDCLIGETGTGTVTINGGTLYAVTTQDDSTPPNLSPTSVYIGNATLNGGDITSDPGSSFEFLHNTELHVTAAGAITADQVSFEAAAAIRIDSGAVLTVSANIVNASPPTGGTSSVGQLTLNGSGTLDLTTPLGKNNVVGNSFTGPVTINGGMLVLDTAGTATGLFPQSPTIIVNNGGALLLGQSNTLIGTSNGSGGVATAVIINPGGELIAASQTTNHVANLTLDGATLASSGTANASGSILFLPTSVITIIDDSFITAQGVVLPAGVALNVPASARLTIYGTLVDSSVTVPGQLTSTGPGEIRLFGTNTYSGATNISAGTLTLKSTASLTKTPTITVAAGAVFTDAGSITSVPAVTVNGIASFGPNYTTGIGVLNLASLTIGSSSNGSNGLVNVVPASSHANRLLIDTGALTLAGTTNAWIGKLGLGNNDLDVQHGNLANITNQLQAGYTATNGGYWNGSHGITSSSAAADSSTLSALGVMLNNVNGSTPLFGPNGALGLFDGINPAVTDVLVKYTYVGDANLDGKIDGSDYTRIDNGFTQHLTGWYNGDFNYDGAVNGSDYTLIDNAFNTQGASLAATTATPLVFIGNSAVPEPGTLGIVAIASAVVLSRRVKIVSRSGVACGKPGAHHIHSLLRTD